MSARTEDGVIIGLEIHVQLNTLNSKLFCSCGLDYHNAPPNTHTCPVCLGLPGSLPVLNRSAVKSAIKVALAMNCEILPQTQFYRKNYYYPDLPKGFQVTQYDYPISVNGYLAIEGDEGHGVRRVRINRVHMEEDPGRLVHEGTIDRSKFTLVDYNRAGVPLLEIVTEPDLRSPKEARRFLNKLRNILEYLDVFDGDLDGAIRVDANISLAGGERAEVKNISSYKGAERALSFEIVRQRNAAARLLCRRRGTSMSCAASLFRCGQRRPSTTIAISRSLTLFRCGLLTGCLRSEKRFRNFPRRSVYDFLKVTA
jgi:aspartyl-tRNA(Asn)/glutamyl-tRNA(Gln) amidotransferase subunit B